MINHTKVLGRNAKARVAKAACDCDSVIERLSLKKAGIVNVLSVGGRYCSRVKRERWERLKRIAVR
jgi:hypothetical protein